MYIVKKLRREDIAVVAVVAKLMARSWPSGGHPQASGSEAGSASRARYAPTSCWGA